MSAKKWKQKKDPLYRGDLKDSVSVPTPGADDSLIRHILYLEGPGRETPYLSTTERREVAERFAQAGSVWGVRISDAKGKGVGHVSNSELLHLMSGNGKGLAKWPSSFEVMQARKYVELHSEHLLDFRKVGHVTAVVAAIFSKS